MHNIETYHGQCEQPKWAPHAENVYSGVSRGNYNDELNFVVIKRALKPSACKSLIDQFEQQQKYPVGVSGYPNDPNIGSYRAMGWSPGLADELSSTFSEYLPQFFHGNGPDLTCPSTYVVRATRHMNRIPCSFNTASKTYRFLGSTPWFRFMKYESGGEHVPHYDAPYHNEEERYITLFSWVLYLNDVPENSGGKLQFVDDGYDNHPQYREEGWNSDWLQQASNEAIIANIRPEEGTLIIFPHWLCHQVEHFNGPVRQIVRGDVAYGY